MANDKKVQSIIETAQKGKMDKVLSFCSNKDPELRAGAATGLQYIKHDDTYNQLIIMLHDADASVRSASASSLGFSGRKSGIEHLRHQMNKDSDLKVKEACKQAIASLGVNGR
ncbi:MAG: HEAT repeat domain-containing protein [Acetanaerobacterium sp.]